MTSLTVPNYIQIAVISVLTGLAAGLSTLAVSDNVKTAVIAGASAAVTTALGFLTSAPMVNRHLVGRTVETYEKMMSEQHAASLGQNSID